MDDLTVVQFEKWLGLCLCIESVRSSLGYRIPARGIEYWI